MTEKAIENDKSLNVPLIPIDEIYLDHEFNCRGYFSPSDCVELAENICQLGLQAPVTVRPVRIEKRIGIDADPKSVQEKYKYVAIAGHRRITAYKINQAEVIPALIRDAYIADFDAKDLNAVENIQRSELNIAQEANAIRHYWMAGWQESDVANRINKSRGWVQIRFQLLNMPQEVQQAAAQGYILQADIRELYKYRDDPKALLDAAGIVKTKRQRGEKKVTQAIKQPDKGSTRKLRGATELFTLQNIIRENLMQAKRDQAIMVEDIISLYGNTLATQTLAWAAGEICTYDMHKAIRDFCAVLGVIYHIPKFTPED